MWLWLAIVIALAVMVEITARLSGLGRPLLYEKTSYGYRVVPGQSVTRFGNRIYYNEQGLRSEIIAPRAPPHTLRILCIGDSITFGSTATDQHLTYPYLLRQELSARDRQQSFEVLNASAGGWAIENEEGWLAENGVFGSHVVVLQVATHDLFQEKAGADVVGRDPGFPDRRPRFALQELLRRYVIPQLAWRLHLRKPDSVIYHHTRADVARTMASLTRIAARVRSEGAQLLILFVQQPRALEPRDELTRYGKSVLFEKAAELRIPVVCSADAMELAGGERAFTDGLHPNALGNRVLAQVVAQSIRQRQSRVDRPNPSFDEPRAAVE